MSYYYNYMLGYEQDGKIHFLGPYDNAGNLREVLSISRSFASDLHKMFDVLSEDRMDQSMRDYFSYTDSCGEKEMETVKYLYLSDLPSGSFIKNGYFLISDINAYHKDHDTLDLFYDTMTAEEYAARLQTELALGRPPKPDDEDEEPIRSVRDYMYFSYPDYYCEEYEATVLRTVADILHPYTYKDPADYRIVVLETEG